MSEPEAVPVGWTSGERIASWVFASIFAVLVAGLASAALFSLWRFILYGACTP